MMASNSAALKETEAFLSTLPAIPGERRLAQATMLLSLLVFLVIVPYAKTPLPQVWAFIPSYESALVVNDLITAALLFGQFGSFRAKAVYILASGYLFTACIAIAHALTFPGLFTDTGLLGAGPQTTAWLYIIWHGGFPLFIIAYALMKDQPKSSVQPRYSVHLSIVIGMMAVLALVAVLTLLTTLGHPLLPAIMAGSHYSPTMIVVISTIWLLSLAALIALKWRRSPSVLDLWLQVVMCTWLCDIALSAVLNGGRFDLGFYAGRIYGLLAASFILLVLLVESGMLYARLLELATTLRQLTSVDALTGIANRRAFDLALDSDWRQATRNGSAFSLLLIDVDHFKKFNDCYGHIAGDDCLRAVAQTLAGNARRAGDVVARYGGEEFAVLLPNTDREEAMLLAERMCETVRQRNIAHTPSEAAQVTISVGVATCRPSDKAVLASTLVEAADKALYVAKQSGRNRVAASS
jgi:diguanylate cyclase (GGDEF)-like protein